MFLTLSVRLCQRYLVEEVEVAALLYLQQHVNLQSALFILQHLDTLYSGHTDGIAAFIIQVVLSYRVFAALKDWKNLVVYFSFKKAYFDFRTVTL